MGLGEEHRHRPPERCELVALGAGTTNHQPLPAEAPQVVGGLAIGVGDAEQSSHQSDQIPVAEAGQQMAEAEQGGEQCHHPRVAELQGTGVQAVSGGRGPGHLGQCDDIRGRPGIVRFGVTQTLVGMFTNRLVVANSEAIPAEGRARDPRFRSTPSFSAV